MINLAYKMLIGNRASCIGVIFGIFLATLLISQQAAIFLGLVDRSYRMVTDISAPTIWVIDPATQSEDKLRPLPKSFLDLVRGIQGVEWAVPLASGSMPTVTPDGRYDISLVYGIDSATLYGAPSQMVKGSILDLRGDGAIIVDEYSAKTILAKTDANGQKHPLALGDTLEINGVHAVVVGINKVTQGFLPQPIIFTSLSQFEQFNPGISNRMGYILVHTKTGENLEAVTNRINTIPGLAALTSEEFKNRIMNYFLGTGILINFGLSVLLGVIIGFSIAGQIFYLMTLENTVYYALIKAVGGTKYMILKMIIFQAAVLGTIGYILGTGVTILWGYAIQDTTLAFLFPWQLLLFTGSIVLCICLFSTLLSIRKVFHVDPKMLMGT